MHAVVDTSTAGAARFAVHALLLIGLLFTPSARASTTGGHATSSPPAGVAASTAAAAADGSHGTAAVALAGEDGERLFGAIVKVESRAARGARSAESLGIEREGNGVAIGEQGLILTIGYLLVEAEEVKVTDQRSRTYPARVVAYDHASGLGLLRTIVPVDLPTLAFGDASSLKERDPVVVIGHGGRSEATLAYVVSLRPFTGSWEYALDQAIFTSPPSLNWSGAALVGPDGRLLGVGSLIVRNAIGGETQIPGNMFVPIDVLKPILDDLVKLGHRAGPARPWLGINADEVQGRLHVSRVSSDGPAARAGIKPGDIILGVGRDGVHTLAEFYARLWAAGTAGSDISLRVLQDLDVKIVTVRSIDRTEYFRPRRTL